VNDSPTAIAVLRTRLPYVDRRALSEAWFSALHLAASESPHGPGGAPRAIVQPSNVAAPHPRAVTQRVPGAAFTTAPRRAARSSAAHGVAPRPRTESTRSRSSAAVETRPRSYPAQRTSLTLAIDGSRVQLVLRREGPLLHVVALCRPDAAPLVRRALANADAHLRRTGESVRASVCVDARVRVTS
jgi:hypothetical protein